MADSIRVLDNNYVDRIHSTKSFGKLHKGHSITAATASIPSQYQTIVIDNSDKKGFLSKARRFQYESDSNINPGPGNYVGHAKFEKRASSFSKKGTGGFASKSSRLIKHKPSSGPGPGKYALPGLLASRQDYNRAVSSNFHKPIAVQKNDTADKESPAPNEYDVVTAAPHVNKTNNVVANAAFKSKTRREGFNPKDAAVKPSPWQYEVNDSLLKSSVRVPLSSFKSTTKRKMQMDIKDNPGPGAYKPFEPTEEVNKTIFPRKHYLCISAPAMALPSTPPSPGPGSYELTDFEGQPKHYMSGSVFVSNTSRWTGDAKDFDFPGPAQYNPRENGKQSFLFNAAGRWI